MEKRTYQAPQVTVTELDITDIIMAASGESTDLTPTKFSTAPVTQSKVDE